MKAPPDPDPQRGAKLISMAGPRCLLSTDGRVTTRQERGARGTAQRDPGALKAAGGCGAATDGLDGYPGGSEGGSSMICTGTADAECQHPDTQAPAVPSPSAHPHRSNGAITCGAWSPVMTGVAAVGQIGWPGRKAVGPVGKTKGPKGVATGLDSRGAESLRRGQGPLTDAAQARAAHTIAAEGL